MSEQVYRSVPSDLDRAIPSREGLAPAFEDHFEQCGNVEVDVGHRGEEGFFDEGTDALVGLAQSPSVIRVSHHALETIEENLLEGLNIGVFAANTDIGAADSIWVCSHWLQNMVASLMKRTERTGIPTGDAGFH